MAKREEAGVPIYMTSAKESCKFFCGSKRSETYRCEHAVVVMEYKFGKLVPMKDGTRSVRVPRYMRACGNCQLFARREA